jgi:hypothetical protein
MPGDLRVDLRVTLLLTVFRRALLFSISIHPGASKGVRTRSYINGYTERPFQVGLNRRLRRRLVS